MTAQWIKYDESDKQIAELCKADKEFGFMVLWENGDYSGVIKNDWSGFDKDIDKYLICDPYPYADMICQWARTGQPVYIRVKGVSHKITFNFTRCWWHIPYYTYETNTPDWNIPGAEYSFTPFEDK